MRKISLIPTIYKQDRCWCDRRHYFQEGIAKKYGFEIRWTEQAELKELSKGAEIVMACSAPSTRNPHCYESLAGLPQKIKFIYYMEDIHDADPFNRIVLKMLERASLVISERYELFIKKWPQYANKLNYLPPYFAPYERYASLPYNEKPKMKCLLSGAINSRYYPLRTKIKEAAESNSKFADMIDVLPHPGYGYWQTQAAIKGKSEDGKRLAINEPYAKLLNEYFCCVTTAAKEGYCLSKYFEVPAAGSLLLADIRMDIDKTGLIPGRHYIPISENDVFLVIESCLKNPEKVEQVRQEGRKYVLANHSVDNRIEEFGNILGKLK